MRYIRILHFLFLAFLIGCDVLLNGAMQALFTSRFSLVFTLSFTGILLLSRTEDSWDTLVKVALVALWLDLNHVGSFPVFFISYMVAALSVQKLTQHLDSTSFHFLMLLIIGIFIKEITMYLLLIVFKDHRESVFHFMAYHTFWSVLLNVIALPLVMKIYRSTHTKILELTQERFMR